MTTISLTYQRGSTERHRNPGRVRRTLGALGSGIATAATVVALKALSPHRAALSRLGQMPLTVAATGLLDTAAWQGPHWLGWAATGVSLLILEHLISDDDPPNRARTA